MRNVLLAAAALAAPLAAQQPMMKMDSMPHPMGMGMMMDDSMMQQMQAAMMGTLLYAPQHLLARKDALNLTADQVARLTALRDAATRSHDAAMTAVRTHLQAMRQAADASPADSAAVKGHFQAMHDAMGNAHWVLLASALRARAVLTDAQRTGMKAWADSMQAWMQQHRQMMGPH